MTPDIVTALLRDRFGAQVLVDPPDAWQVELPDCRLLALLSADGSWLRLLLPLVPLSTVQPFLEQVLAANFDQTQETRYALHESVLWGVFHHDLATLTPDTFQAAVDRLLQLQTEGTDGFFQGFLDQRLRQIIQAAKRQGQSLEMTLQTLDRFYSEGLMGDMTTGGQSEDRALAAWQRQLTRLWPEVQP
jgi:hypothetical protein